MISAKCTPELSSPEKTAKSSVCEASFHPSRTRMKSLETYKQMNKDRRAKWKCDQCAAGGKRSRNTDESSDSVEDGGESAGAFDVVTAFAKLSTQMAALTSVPASIADLKESVEFISTQFDAFVADTAQMKSSFAKLENKNQQLKMSVETLQSKVN